MTHLDQAEPVEISLIDKENVSLLLIFSDFSVTNRITMSGATWTSELKIEYFYLAKIWYDTTNQKIRGTPLTKNFQGIISIARGSCAPQSLLMIWDDIQLYFETSSAT